jgi:hypothetical protein
MGNGKILSRSSVAALAIMGASCRSVDKPSPLPDLHDVTRVIALPFGESSHEFRPPRDSLRLAMLAEALQQFPAGWTTSTDDPPHPNLGATFLRDSAIVAVLWIGPEFIAAFAGKERRQPSQLETDSMCAEPLGAFQRDPTVSYLHVGICAFATMPALGEPSAPMNDTSVA